jgi:hypothetical protein
MCRPTAWVPGFWPGSKATVWGSEYPMGSLTSSSPALNNPGPVIRFPAIPEPPGENTRPEYFRITPQSPHFFNLHQYLTFQLYLVIA